MCNCGKAAPDSQQEFVVTSANGTTKTFTTEPEARIFATLHNGKVVTRKK